MSKKFQSSFDEFLSSRIQDGLNRHRSENENYRKLKQANLENFNSIDELIQSLPENDQSIFERFFENELNTHAEEEAIIYHQGLKDCANILKTLGVL